MNKKKRKEDKNILILSVTLIVLVVLLLLSIYLLVNRQGEEPVLYSPETINCTEGCQPAQGAVIEFMGRNYSFFANTFNLTNHFRNGEYVYDVDGFNLNLNNGSDLFRSPVMKNGDVWENESFYNFSVRMDAYAVVDTIYRANITFIDLSINNESLDDEGNLQDVSIQCDVGYALNLTSCFDDRIIEFPNVYNITQGCLIENVTIPDNVTLFSDCNGNRVVGHEEDIEDMNFNAKVYIEEEKINNTKNYSGGRKVVEIREGDVAVVSFDFDFSDALDLSKVRIEKSDYFEDDFGYLIVEGLAGEDKTFRFEKLDFESDSVCVKDRSGLGNITSSFSRKCNGSGEILVECDGQENGEGYKCSIRDIDNEEYFVVSTLKNSGVKEILPDEVDDSGGSSNTNTNMNTKNDAIDASDKDTDTKGNNQINVNNQRFENTQAEGFDESDDSSRDVVLWVIIGVLIVAVLIVGIVLMMLVVNKKEKPSNRFGAGVRVNVPISRRQGF
jgi:flagellar basal body-associated protein FliL